MKYNSIGEQLIAKAREIDPNYKPDKFNDMSEAIDVILNNTGGGGEGLNILSLNLKDCMNESDYNELVGYVLQKTVIAKTYNITLPDLTDVDIVKFTIETSDGNMNTTFYRNSKAITQFNWLCNWTDDENFIQMVTITGYTDNNVKYIKYNGIGSGGSGFNLFDNLWVLSEVNANFETMTLTEVGLNKLNNMYTSGKLLGITDGEPSPTANYMSVITLKNFTDNTYYFSNIFWKDNSLQFVQLTINKTTGAIEMVQKIITATDA